MTFTANVKEELAHASATCSHCERAMLAGILRIEGTLFVGGKNKHRLEVAIDAPSVARTTIQMLHNLYDIKTSLTLRRSVLHKTTNYLIECPAQKKLSDALLDLGVLTAEGSLVLGVAPHLVAKQCCTAAYLRGVFLGSGFIANPNGNFHFEIVVETQNLASDIANLMHQNQIDAKVVQRRSSYKVYLKNGDAILRFLALCGAHKAALEMENARVIKSVRSAVNRQTNAEVANQAKASRASLNQLNAIRTVLQAYGMKNLSPALQDFIKLRVAHPEATLKELGALAKPPLSKSAVNHRVRRLEEMATKVT